MANRRTQQQRILDLLLEGFRQHREISLPEILNLRIGLYNTRIKELRAAGWQIVNRMDAVEGQRRSFYSLKSAFLEKVIPEPKPLVNAIDESQKCTRVHEQPALLQMPQQIQTSLNYEMGKTR